MVRLEHDNPDEMSPAASGRCLLLVAGPSGVGKSTLLTGLHNGAFPDLEREAGISGFGALKVVGTRRIRPTDLPDASLIGVHYDFVRQTNLAPVELLRDHLRTTHDLTVIVMTLYASRALLTERLESRRADISLLTLRPRTLLKRIARLAYTRRALHAYRTVGRWEAMYDRWIRSVQALQPARHLLIDVSGAVPTVRMRIDHANPDILPVEQVLRGVRTA